MLSLASKKIALESANLVKSQNEPITYFKLAEKTKTQLLSLDMRKMNFKSTYIPLSSISALFLLLLASSLQVNSQKKNFFIDIMRQLELANEKLGSIVGNSRDTLHLGKKRTL